ncbi:MAG: hypothetical protein BGN85_10970 [Alphaproteobacteria bacterium 64-11]|nr:DUF2163 domain-containing protein [Alphaproteobacteria bacterium]OJU09904.1 MAG: hypothetical protein BGN85_10970 [Alphaproteobacteria bacterium 64-11]
MKTLPSGLQAHLDGGATTLCWCWKLTRRDNVVQGFTDHDRSLSFDGVTYDAVSGFTASQVESGLGLAVDNLTLAGALSSATLNEDELAAGLYDNAAIQIWRVNWAAVDQRVLMRAGTIGEVTRNDGAFQAEIRGLTQALNQPVGRVFGHLCDADLGDGRCGIAVSASAGTVATAFFFDAVEREGKIVFAMRGRAVPTAYDADGLVLPDNGAAISLVRAQESDLPQASRIAYIDGGRDYAQASVESRRLAGTSNRVATSSLPLVMDQEEAGGIGARLLQDAWVMRESAQFSLPPSALALDAGDEVALTAGGRAHRLRLTGIDDGTARAVQAIATDPSIYDRYAGPVRAPALGQTPSQPGRALLIFLELPWLRDDQNIAAPFVGAYADPWPGDVAVLRSATTSGYVRDVTLTTPCSFGVTVEDFYSGPRWHWDRVNSLKLRLVNGALSSAGSVAVYGGANALAVQNPDGGWEVVQYADAALTGPGEYTLTNLLRGRRGSEGQMRSPVPAGARVVVLDESLVQLGLSTGQARQPFNYLWGPVSRPISDVSWQGAARTFEGTALIPLAPCHLAFAWDGGDLNLSWRRRDRAPSAAAIALPETPMSEARQAYDLEICAGETVVRTASGLGEHAYVYTAAQQAADFPGGLPNPLIIRVYQLSSLIGRGRQAKEALYVS